MQKNIKKVIVDPITRKAQEENNQSWLSFKSQHRFGPFTGKCMNSYQYLAFHRSPNCGLRTISSTTALEESWLLANTIFATSSASIMRWGSIPEPSQLALLVAPGKTAVTLIPYGFNSSLKCFVKPS